MAVLFWFVVVVWLCVDIYFVFLRRVGYYTKVERRTKIIVTFLILLGVFLASLPESFRESWAVREFGTFQIIGTFVLLLGVVLRIISILTLGKYFAGDILVNSERKLVKSGIYRWVRHPSYTGEIIAFLGLAIVFEHIPSSLFIFIFPSLAFIYRAIVEEKFLELEFGQEYIEYKKKTKMFIPFLL